MKTYTIDDIKEAFEDGYYEGAGDDAWYRAHDEDGKLNADASVHRLIKEHVDNLERKHEQKV